MFSLRIAVSGTHGIGKTTLVNYIHEKTKLSLLGENARTLLENKYPFAKVDSDLKTFKDFQSDIINSQTFQERSHESFVVDRPLIDSFVYVQERLTKERDDDLQYFYDYWHTILSHHKRQRYDVIFFIRFDAQFRDDDDFRNSNFFYMKMIDELLEYQYLSKGETFSDHIVHIYETVHQERRDTVNRVLKDYGF